MSVDLRQPSEAEALITTSKEYFEIDFPWAKDELVSEGMVFDTQLAHFVVGLTATADSELASVVVEANQHGNLDAQPLELESPETPRDVLLSCIKHGLDEVYPELLEEQLGLWHIGRVGISLQARMRAPSTEEAEEAWYDSFAHAARGIPVDRSLPAPGYLMMLRNQDPEEGRLSVVSSIFATGFDAHNALGVPPQWPYVEPILFQTQNANDRI